MKWYYIVYWTLTTAYTTKDLSHMKQKGNMNVPFVKNVNKTDTLTDRKQAFHLYKTALDFCQCDSTKNIEWDERGVITKVKIDSLKK